MTYPLAPLCRGDARLRSYRARPNAFAVALILGWLCLAPHSALASAEGSLAFHKGVAAFGVGDQPAAQAHFEAALAADPDNAAALRYLALIAKQRGDSAAALGLLERAVALEPASASARGELALELLEAGRNEDALDQLALALESDPKDAGAWMAQGVALYRLKRYDDAVEALLRVGGLDSALELEANYYIGLAEAYRGDRLASAEAFERVVNDSPEGTLGRSARELLEQVTAPRRRWSLSATTGFEYNDNVTLDPGIEGATTSEIGSPAWMANLYGQVSAFRTERANVQFGYEGTIRIHTNSELRGTPERPQGLDELSNAVWVRASYDLSRARVSLRYAFSHTALDLTDSLRTIQRVSPAVYIPVGNWGLTQLYYEFLDYDYGRDIVIENEDFFDRSGPQHTVGVQQFVFLPEPLNYLVIGALVSDFNSVGTEWRHQGFEISAGGEGALWWGINMGLLYRFQYRDHSQPSFFDDSDPDGIEHEHRISLNLHRFFGAKLKGSIAASYRSNSSYAEQFDIDRFIIGTYVTYGF